MLRSLVHGGACESECHFDGHFGMRHSQTEITASFSYDSHSVTIIDFQSNKDYEIYGYNHQQSLK